MIIKSLCFKPYLKPKRCFLKNDEWYRKHKSEFGLPFCPIAQLQKIGLEIPKAWISRKNI
ncbi:hypothetical protein HPHPH42_0831 [Helicobacter pylori Hp H-42]|uniref:Uncharacterized protein n=1 Tax=Helicobacter pylori Hp H-42 TaxID=992047 RepID=A0AB33XHY3_HELPX|nr:hypothetical protein HPHPH42_0831 [Helicobacter pylori Hp H-42]